MGEIETIKKEIEKIKKRNQRVEVDKAWETSLTRRLLVAILTYIVIVILFFFAGVSDPLFNSIIPALAFILSTSSLPFLKKLWLKYVYRYPKTSP